MPQSNDIEKVRVYMRRMLDAESVETKQQRRRLDESLHIDSYTLEDYATISSGGSSCKLAVSDFELFVCQDTILRKTTFDGKIVATHSVGYQDRMSSLAIRKADGVLSALLEVPEVKSMPPGLAAMCTAYVGAIDVLVARPNKKCVSVLSQELESKYDINLETAPQSLRLLPGEDIGVRHADGSESKIGRGNICSHLPKSINSSVAYDSLLVEASGLTYPHDPFFGLSPPAIRAEWVRSGIRTPTLDDIEVNFLSPHIAAFVTSVFNSGDNTCLSLVSIATSNTDRGHISQLIAYSCATKRTASWSIRGVHRLRFAHSIVCSGAYIFISSLIPMNRNSNWGAIYVFRAAAPILDPLIA